MNEPKIQSMTGFARSCAESSDQDFVWEIRSVNHRYLNFSFKLPPEMHHIESRIRDRIQAVIHRGHIEISLRVKSAFRDNLDGLNQDNLDALAKLMLGVHERHPNLLPSSVSELLMWPGILPEQLISDDIESLPGFQGGLDQLVHSRLKEGIRLSRILRKKLEHCLSVIDRLQEELPDIENRAKQKLLQRIDEMKCGVESERIAHEIALLLIKNDVTEELDRLQSHLAESISLLDEGGPVGRRLDFLMQELNREANTLGAKSMSKSMTRASIDLKLLIEQTREQVQNLE